MAVVPSTSFWTTTMLCDPALGSGGGVLSARAVGASPTDPKTSAASRRTIRQRPFFTNVCTRKCVHSPLSEVTSIGKRASRAPWPRHPTTSGLLDGHLLLLGLAAGVGHAAFSAASCAAVSLFSWVAS